jgi:hypothetical protein
MRATLVSVALAVLGCASLPREFEPIEGAVHPLPLEQALGFCKAFVPGTFFHPNFGYYSRFVGCMNYRGWRVHRTTSSTG